MYYPYDIKLYIILHIKSSHHNFEDNVNVNRLYNCTCKVMNERTAADSQINSQINCQINCRIN